MFDNYNETRDTSYFQLQTQDTSSENMFCK